MELVLASSEKCSLEFLKIEHKRANGSGRQTPGSCLIYKSTMQLVQAMWIIQKRKHK